MIRSLYTSAHSMVADIKKLDTISNNIANADTTAFKKDLAIYRSFSEMLTTRIKDTKIPLNPYGRIGYMSLGDDVGQIFTDYTQGPLQFTEKKLDIAISNADYSFFNVGTINAQGEVGNVYLTRDGELSLNDRMQLVTKDGYFILGQNGPITVTKEEIVIDNRGYVFEDNELIDQLQITTFENSDTLRKTGNNMITSTVQGQQGLLNGQVIQGYLEKSNVNAINEMVDLITVMRSYEANQKLIQNEDSILQKAVSEIGSLR